MKDPSRGDGKRKSKNHADDMDEHGRPKCGSLLDELSFSTCLQVRICSGTV